MESREIKFPSSTNNNIQLKAIPGHFATNHSHVNYYIDLTTMKTRANEAHTIATSLVQKYVHNTVVDTIVCMDGCDVIGAYLAEELTHAGFLSQNAHKTIYVVTPEFNTNGQMVFRDNIQPCINGKNIILLLANATTGKTVDQSVECIQYYGGNIQGISAIFSAVNTIDGIGVDALFTPNDIPNYSTYQPRECPFCKKNIKLEAIVSSYGYTKL